MSTQARTLVEELDEVREKLTRVREQNRHLQAKIDADPDLRAQLRLLRKGLSYIAYAPNAPTDAEGLKQVARNTLEETA